jgi:hypothetical protein
MSTDKKERPLTIKSWLRKADSKVSADAFLKASRNFLETSELVQISAPILLSLDAGEILPTPALESLKLAMLAHFQASELLKAEASLLRESAPAPTQNYTATVYNVKGEIQVYQAGRDKQGQPIYKDLIRNCLLPQEGMRFLDRTIAEGAPDWFGTLVSNVILIDGEPLTEIVMRGDAMARMYPKAKGPMTKRQSKGDGKLSFGVRCKQDHASFSRG